MRLEGSLPKVKRIISAMALGIRLETFVAYTSEKAHAYQRDDCTITYRITNEWIGKQQVVDGAEARDLYHLICKLGHKSKNL